MFYARTDALRPLLRLGLTDEDFEPESGQVDGTLAHVIERVIAYSALAAGFRVGEVANSAGGPECAKPMFVAPTSASPMPTYSDPVVLT